MDVREIILAIAIDTKHKKVEVVMRTHFLFVLSHII